MVEAALGLQNDIVPVGWLKGCERLAAELGSAEYSQLLGTNHEPNDARDP